MVDDSYYITPHETALAVIATAMKKSRLRLDTLIVNSIMGGILFSAGSMLYLNVNSMSPGSEETSPGLLNHIGALTYSFGLFYVVICGVDLFNSNVLFFTVGVLRGAVNIYDLLISWFVSWWGNFGGTLFMCYIICHLSGITSKTDMKEGSKAIVDKKIEYNFIETFIKGIAGNFCVCLAVYLQLMAKPLHVKLLMIILPIFTFVAMSFTHVVADMYLLMMGMINGADLSIAKFVWRSMLPATLGNIVGGAFFGAVIPFYLHLVVVERDRKRLDLPEFEARDEQPELNTDSRVVRLSPPEAHWEEEQDTSSDEDEDDGNETEKLGESTSDSYTDSDNAGDKELRPYTPGILAKKRTTLNDSLKKVKTRRSPAGVFPVRGMGPPLARERTIVDPEDIDEVIDKSLHKSGKERERNRSLTRGKTVTIAENHGNNYIDNDNDNDNDRHSAGDSSLNSFDLMPSNSDADSEIYNPVEEYERSRNSSDNSIKSLSKRETLKKIETKQLKRYEQEGGYNVMNHKLGTQLERAITKLAPIKSWRSSLDEQEGDSANVNASLPRTNQDLENNVFTRTATEVQTASPKIFNALKKTFTVRKEPDTVNNFHDRLSAAGITQRAADASDYISGVEDYKNMQVPTRSANSNVDSASIKPSITAPPKALKRSVSKYYNGSENVGNKEI
ncbi:uncharacterized protein SCODWIG_02925 [Saccharomycodes ludwigii]|uniref:Transporter n=1 Tax=Saccharomycodes ludwigii TaxID=36035 RepID=A0A376B9F5_9ASCO|nr:hypothetical protein SCDLUD_005240 [Saccharomycodes ludwigii]KAH3898898.1 hypothetical protein SCDLUD_005240 [Saccharomycodes ludwigii]SSD61164.1 uncharacterized protein SCODWIG_02925 [Saccharomycodes ludwigii]